jgi:hypothetical protein
MLLLLFLLLALFSPLVGLIDQVHRRACASPAERNETKTKTAKAKAKAKANGKGKGQGTFLDEFSSCLSRACLRNDGVFTGKTMASLSKRSDLFVRFLSLSVAVTHQDA